MKCNSLLLFLLLSISALSQKHRDVMPYQWAVSVSPLAFADIDHAAMFGGEYRITKKWAVTGDAGYVFASDYLEKARKASGINSRASVRYYRGWRDNEFWQAQFLYKLVDYTMHDWLGKDCVNDVPAYDQLQDFVFRKQVLGFKLMAGDIRPVFSEDLFLEINLGFGIRYKTQKVVNIKNACYDMENIRALGIYADKVWMPSIPFSVKLAYVIK